MICLCADRCEITPNGDLLFLGSFKGGETRPEQILVALAQGEWKEFFAASAVDGSAVAVYSWESDEGEGK